MFRPKAILLVIPMLALVACGHDNGDCSSTPATSPQCTVVQGSHSCHYDLLVNSCGGKTATVSVTTTGRVKK